MAAGRVNKRSAHLHIATIFATDLVAQIVAIAVILVIQFGAITAIGVSSGWLLAIVLPAAWVIVVAASGGYKLSLLSSRQAEVRNLLHSAVYAAGGACILFNTFASGISQGAIFATVGVALILTLIGRWQIRRIVTRAWNSGHATTGVVLVGSLSTILDTAERLATAPDSGLRVVGLCVSTPDQQESDTQSEILVPGLTGVVSDADLLAVVKSTNAGLVIVTSPSSMGTSRVREIAWMLESTDADLMLSTGLDEVADHRLKLRRIGKSRFISVDQPMYTGIRRTLHDVGERILAGAGFIALSPIIAAVVIAVRLDSKGPAFFIQSRVGRGGELFRMFKFRSMVVDAEALRDAVEPAEGEPDRGPMFKCRHDPRITRVGRFLRKSSLDELPQLLNVVLGSMTLVGPRPALPVEVEKYAGAEHRRLLVKPGITGIWQVSGRSDLSWDETVNLDLHYVENWSPAMDISIMSRTLRAVTRSAGAY